MTNIKTTIWKSLLFLAVFALTISILVVPYMKFIDKQLSKSVSRLAIDIVSILPVLFASWVMTKYIEKMNFVKIGLENKNLLKDILIGTSLGLFWVFISFVGQYIFGTLSRTASTQTIDGDFIFYTAALLLNAAVQELLCRGYLFKTIQKNIGIKTAVITTSLIFLLMHGGAMSAGIIPSLNVFGAGIIFAIAAYKTGQLWLPIALHFTWNFMYSSILYKPIESYVGLELFQTKGNVLLAGGQNGVEATIITTITILIIILIEQFSITQREQH